VLIDTNILAERTRLLRTGLGPSLLFLAKTREIKIVIPEVIRLEASRYVTRSVTRVNGELNSGFRQIRELVGESPAPELPSDAAVIKSFDERLHQLRPWILEISTSDDLVRRAAARVFAKRAPSHRDGEDSFKDCLIWESLLDIAKGAHIDLVSNDARAFFDPTDKQRLHPDLMKEAENDGLAVRPHRDLQTLVEEIQGTAPEYDYERAHVALNSALAPAFITAMNDWKIEQLHDPAFVLKSFLTEQPGIAYVEFVAEANVTFTAEVGLQKYQEPVVRLEGSLNYDPHGPIRDLQVTVAALIASDGREITATRTIFARGVVQLGAPKQRFSFMAPLSAKTAVVKTKPRN
jgi:hypothetical protein